jgi:hypothetical protein
MILAVIDAIIGVTVKHVSLIKGANKDEWLYSTAHEFGWLTKGFLPHKTTGME